MQQEEKTQIRKDLKVGSLLVEKIYKSDYQKEGTLTAQLRQTVETKSHYPSKSVVTDLQDNVFNMADFGFEETTYENIEKRVAWIDVPENTSLEDVILKVTSFPKACLYRILSSKPILSSHQKYAVDSEEIDITLDHFSDSQAVRYGEDGENPGALILDENGKVQYRAVFFSKVKKEDIDQRTVDPADSYTSPAISAEVNNTTHVIVGQEIT